MHVLPASVRPSPMAMKQHGRVSMYCTEPGAAFELLQRAACHACFACCGLVALHSSDDRQRQPCMHMHLSVVLVERSCKSLCYVPGFLLLLPIWDICAYCLYRGSIRCSSAACCVLGVVEGVGPQGASV